jgi:hypothetical protein
MAYSCSAVQLDSFLIVIDIGILFLTVIDIDILFSNCY